jgi:type II secretory pathway predicted ATPase ExeA
LLQALRQSLDGDTAVSYVFNTTLPFDGILEYVTDDLGIAKPEESSPAGRLNAWNNFLAERERAGQNTVLLIDEAQNLDAATLERISMLSGFETASKLLRVLLVGQPELEAKLDHPDLRRLRQRISLRCQIPPLGAEETDEYIRSRLRVAGAPDVALFNEPAIGRIADYSGGIPRVINILGDHCLLFGYADQKRRIDKQIVNQAIAYLEQDGQAPRKVFSARGLRSLRRFRWALGTVGIALASAVVGFALGLLSGGG